MNKNGIFFTLDILVAIVIVFLFAIFFMSNLSFTMNTAKFSDLQLSTIGSDISLVIFEKEYINLAIAGSDASLEYFLNQALPEQICSRVTILEEGSSIVDVSKTGCVQEDTIFLTKSPLYYENSNYIIEVRTWVQ